MTASKYSYLGGFSGTSNVLAGKLANIAIRGTHAHAFVMSYNTREDLKFTTIKSPSGDEVDFYELVMAKQKVLGYDGTIGNTSFGELLAFIAYAQSNPTGFVALVDTYDTLSSGVPNFLIVGLALHELGYHPIGIRLDSGDLSYLSKETRKLYIATDKRINVDVFSRCKIVASNDIDEKVILSLNTEGHEIDVLAVGTRLVTCYTQPALGCVYKLVEINGKPRIKLSQETEKMVIPSRKAVYRLIGKEDRPIIDIMMLESEPPPLVDHKILCRHPFMESKRAFVTPSKVIPLLHLVWDCKNGIAQPQPSFEDSRRLCWENIQSMREDHIRPMNATPYKVSLSSSLFEFFHQLIQSETPIADLS
jgi:nicotinate phosphoribosyltransferase